MTDLTIDEAEAWRAGYCAALEAALGVIADECGDNHPAFYGVSKIEVPAPPPMPDGLCGRGA